MKISELIKTLEKRKSEHGDLSVIVSFWNEYQDKNTYDTIDEDTIGIDCLSNYDEPKKYVLSLYTQM